MKLIKKYINKSSSSIVCSNTLLSIWSFLKIGNHVGQEIGRIWICNICKIRYFLKSCPKKKPILISNCCLWESIFRKSTFGDFEKCIWISKGCLWNMELENWFSWQNISQLWEKTDLSEKWFCQKKPFQQWFSICKIHFLALTDLGAK